MSNMADRVIGADGRVYWVSTVRKGQWWETLAFEPMGCLTTLNSRARYFVPSFDEGEAALDYLAVQGMVMREVGWQMPLRDINQADRGLSSSFERRRAQECR